jgi:hypothetical protein
MKFEYLIGSNPVNYAFVNHEHKPSIGPNATCPASPPTSHCSLQYLTVQALYSLVAIRKINESIQHPVQGVENFITRIAVRESHTRVELVAHAHPCRHARHSRDDFGRNRRVRIGCMRGIVRGGRPAYGR